MRLDFKKRMSFVEISTSPNIHLKLSQNIILILF